MEALKNGGFHEPRPFVMRSINSDTCIEATSPGELYLGALKIYIRFKGRV